MARELSSYQKNRGFWIIVIGSLSFFTAWSFGAPQAKEWYMDRGLAGAPLLLKSPADGSVISTPKATIKGTASSPLIRVVVNDRDIVEAVPVQWDGTWTVTVDSRSLIGDLRFIESSSDRFRGRQLAVRYMITAPPKQEETADPEMAKRLRNRVIVASHQDNAPVFSGIIRFTGTARPGARITGFRGKTRIATVMADQDGFWELETVVRKSDSGTRFKFEDTDLPQHFAALRLEVLD